MKDESSATAKENRWQEQPRHALLRAGLVVHSLNITEDHLYARAHSCPRVRTTCVAGPGPSGATCDALLHYRMKLVGSCAAIALVDAYVCMHSGRRSAAEEGICSSQRREDIVRKGRNLEGSSPVLQRAVSHSGTHTGNPVRCWIVLVAHNSRLRLCGFGVKSATKLQLLTSIVRRLVAYSCCGRARLTIFTG